MNKKPCKHIWESVGIVIIGFRNVGTKARPEPCPIYREILQCDNCKKIVMTITDTWPEGVVS